MTYHQLRVAKIIQETADARSFVLDVPVQLADQFRYRAGQFLTFEITNALDTFNRCYSLSSAPETDGRQLKVTVKRVPGGKGSNWFNDSLEEGCLLRVLPPAGRFVLKDNAAPLLLFGGGSGITPMISIIKSALHSSSRRIRLYYANRDRSSIIFENELLNLAQRHPARFELINHLDIEQGLTTRGEILTAMTGFDDAEAYLCGPTPFMNFVEQTLLSAGMSRARVLIERFEASGESDALPSQEAGEIVPGEITVHFENKVYKVPYNDGQTILAAVRAAGLNPMSSCEEGFCATCAAKRIKGKIIMVKNDVYTADDLAQGWILTCQGHCFGPEVEISFDIS